MTQTALALDPTHRVLASLATAVGGGGTVRPASRRPAGLAEEGGEYRAAMPPAAADGRRVPGGDWRRQEAADYLADMAAELADIARRADLVFLAYILDMAREEALMAGVPR